MTTQEQIIAIAELDGWHNIQPNPLYPNRYAGFTKGDTHALCGIPDYLTSRDAIIPVVEKQSNTTKIHIVHHLQNMQCIKHEDGWTTEDVYTVLLSTPQQLAEALLRATGKWKD